MVVKGRSPALGHVSRTHRVDLDWLFERCRVDLSIRIRFVPTKAQLADMITKGSFTASAWGDQCRLWEIGPPGRVSTSTLPERVSHGKKSPAGKTLKLNATCRLNAPGWYAGTSTACACIDYHLSSCHQQSFYPSLCQDSTTNASVYCCLSVAIPTLKNNTLK